jgi:transcription termination factor Rho
MYDILQLNDMLVPELLDIAEELKIENARKLNKQELVYKILDRQAVVGSQKKSAPTGEKPKRKRIVKASTAHSTEEAVVEDTSDNEPEEEAKKPIKKAAPKREIAKKPRRKGDDQPEMFQEDAQPAPQPVAQQQQEEPEQEDEEPIEIPEKTVEISKFFQTASSALRITTIFLLPMIFMFLLPRSSYLA